MDSPSKPGYHSNRSEPTVQMVPKRCSWGCYFSGKFRNRTNWLTSRRRCYVQYARQTKESGAPPERDGPCTPLWHAQGPRVCTWSTWRRLRGTQPAPHTGAVRKTHRWVHCTLIIPPFPVMRNNPCCTHDWHLLPGTPLGRIPGRRRSLRPAGAKFTRIPCVMQLD